MVAAALIDPFHRALHERLSEEYQKRVSELANGSAASVMGTTASVAENYAAQVSYLKALANVLDICQDLETERYGSKKPQSENMDGA